MPKQAITDVPGAPAAIGPYSRAIWADNLLFLAGLTGIDPATGELVTGGVEIEAEQTLRNVEIILVATGSSVADVVKATVYLTDMDDFAAANAVYARHFKEPFPARTTVAVKALPKGARIEVEVVALRSS